MQIADVDDTIKRINSHRGVTGVIITTRDGMPIRTTIDNTSTVLYVGGMMALEERCGSIIRDIDPNDKLCFMRVRSRRFEVLLTTEDDYMVFVIQNPNET